MILASEQNAEREAEPASPPLSSYSPEAERLDEVVDLLGQLIAVTLGAAGVKKPPQPKPRRRPRTARDDAEHRIRMRKHDQLVARFAAAKKVDDG